MASATAMPRPPPPPGPPPSARHVGVASAASTGSKPKPPPPPPPRATGQQARPPPPPRPPAGLPPKHIAPSKPPAPVAGAKRQAEAPPARSPPTKKLRSVPITIYAPAALRDVNVFQKKHQVGQGTYGSVFVGADKQTGEIVALKRINTEQEANGFPITAIREVKILKALSHVNIIKLKEIVTSKEQGEQGEVPKNVFMVFEYLEFDLTGILETPEIRLTQDHIKSWSQQLLSGVHYMHINKVIHRDLKASNLLVNRKGELKIADWGLARLWNNDLKRMTNPVITLWYRPPELLLGYLLYTTKVDMWSVGCIIAEMFRRRGFLRGDSEATQLDLIFRTCGHPTPANWPELPKKSRLWKNFEPAPGEPRFPRKLRESLKTQLPFPKWMTDNALDLIDKLMSLDPEQRWSAEQALDADYFFEAPIVKPANMLPMRFSVDSVHEWEVKAKHSKLMAQRKAQNGTRPPPPPPKGSVPGNRGPPKVSPAVKPPS